MLKIIMAGVAVLLLSGCGEPKPYRVVIEHPDGTISVFYSHDYSLSYSRDYAHETFIECVHKHEMDLHP